MRAMAILYIGPHFNPDFASDYHISPILTPAQILAKFPPLLLQCGEKDPLVDDTIIFAGRVREAKRQRREEIRKMLAIGPGNMDDIEFQRLEDELGNLEVESDEDWLQMQIFSGWSHGYLQMPLLMPEAQVAIDDLATWIQGVFTAVSPSESRVLSDSSVETAASEIEPRSPYLSHILPWVFHKSVARSASNGNAVPVCLDGDTAPRVRITTPGIDDVGSSGNMPEADFEDSVTIIPKVRRESTMGGDDLQRGGEATRREKIRKGVAAYNGSCDAKMDPIVEGCRPVRSPPRTPKGFDAVVRAGTPGKSGVVGVGGQVITESELMRRRRLLESHIFVSESTM
jgi:hypothetical protein